MSLGLEFDFKVSQGLSTEYRTSLLEYPFDFFILESLCVFSMGNIHLATTGRIFDLSSEPYRTKLCVIISSGSFPFCFIFVMIFKC